MAKRSSTESPSKISDRMFDGVVIITVIVMGIYHVVYVVGNLIINRAPKS